MKYEDIKGRLFARVSNTADVPDEMPQVQIEDLVLTLEIVLGEETRIPFDHEMYQSMGVPHAELFEEALKNSAEIRPVKAFYLSDFPLILSGYDPEEPELPWFDAVVLTNCNNYLGASALFYPDALKKARDAFGEDFYCLPSSIHEWILIPASQVDGDVQSLKDMVRTVNDTEVKPEERLSYSVYKYTEAKGFEEVK